jgi:topoisomerase-4 subunit A
LPFRPLDDYLSCVATYSNQNVSLYDSYGKFYNILVIDLPSARGHGEPITAKLNMPQGAKILGIFDMKKTDIALVGSNGYGFVTKTPPLVKTKLGLPALRLDDDIQAVPPVSLESYTHLALITNKDNMLVITKDEIPVKTKSKGNKLVSLLKDEFVITIKECNADKGIKLKKNISSEKLKKYLGKKGNKPKTLPFKNI